MARFLSTLVLLLIIVGGIWVLMNRDQIEQKGNVIDVARDQFAPNQYSNPQNPLGLGFKSDFRQRSLGNPHLARRPDGSLPISHSIPPTQMNVVPQGPTIRVASFKLNGYDTTIGDTRRLPLLTKICRQYDAIALQGVNGSDDTWLEMLADSLNATGNQADYYFINDREATGTSGTQSAIMFNRRTLALDEMNWYTVNDPDDLMLREPLVAWFRTRLNDPDRALTFTLVNVELASAGRTSGPMPKMELVYLNELFRAVRNDGRMEDDIVIAGDFNAGDHGLQPIQNRSGLTWVVSNTPTDVRNTTQADNLVFDERATIEFTGRGGVFDFMREFNLSLHDAESLSKRLPVWAEFSAVEGLRQSRIMSNRSSDRR